HVEVPGTRVVQADELQEARVGREAEIGRVVGAEAHPDLVTLADRIGQHPAADTDGAFCPGIDGALDRGAGGTVTNRGVVHGVGDVELGPVGRAIGALIEVVLPRSGAGGSCEAAQAGEEYGLAGEANHLHAYAPNQESGIRKSLSNYPTVIVGEARGPGTELQSGSRHVNRTSWPGPLCANKQALRKWSQHSSGSGRWQQLNRLNRKTAKCRSCR